MTIPSFSTAGRDDVITAEPPPVSAGGCSPGLVTAHLHDTWDFYTTHLGFRTEEAWDDYVLLVHTSGARLGLLQQETNGDLPELVGANGGLGWWLRLAVDDLEATRASLAAAGVPAILRSAEHRSGEPVWWTRDPNGVWIALAQRRGLQEASAFAAARGR